MASKVVRRQQAGKRDSGPGGAVPARSRAELAAAADKPSARRSARGKGAEQASKVSASRRAATPTSGKFPVVMVGSSAGGLEAFKQFFARMPTRPGMAFVLIPHLDPSHKSLMVELLAKQTSMPVVEATQRMLIRPDHVYVIPPNRYLAVRHSRLLLSAPPPARGAQTAIDAAMRSLAEDQQEEAIGIVLSGTGSHGTAGLRQIKLAGGMVMVQEPTTAQHDQMPRSALAAGIAIDSVLAPEQMPEALVAYARHLSQDRGHDGEARGAATRAGLDTVLAVLKARARADFRPYRKNMVLRRVQRRMALLRIEEFGKYAERLRRDDHELNALRRDLSIGVTAFFREPEAFGVLATRILPKLIRRASIDAPVRVWVPACSTGEEAYSIAMLLFEQFRAAGQEAHLQIFASDIDEESLKHARRGVYSDAAIASLSTERLRDFFTRIDAHHFQVSKLLREAVVFAPQNLISDPPFSRLDLISCRNVLIYLEPDIQAKLIANLHFALQHDGYLLLGPAESVGAATDLFEPVSRKWRVYRRIGSARRELGLPIDTSRPRQPAVGPPEARRERSADVSAVLRKLLLDEFAPAALLVNRKYEVLSVLGPVVDYLEFPPGKLSHDLMAMARDNLRARIRAACQKAIRAGHTVRDANARVRRNGRYFLCELSVRPVVGAGLAEDGLLLVFRDRGPVPAAERRRHGAARDASAVRQLEDELRATRDDLQRAITELESSNEDLKASNEEIMSMNEELQSTNEELETSKEELQSLNEELSTVNSQLEEKVNDLDGAHTELTNLTAATDIAILFLDPDLRIQRFTAPAAKLLGLLPGDAGRSVSDFALRLTGGDLATDSRRVMTTMTVVETEVHSAVGRDYLRRILPYRGAQGPIGVIVVFIDVTDRLQAEAQTRRLAAVLRDSGDAICVINLEGTITAWNRGAEAMYGYPEAEALRLNLRDLAADSERAQALDFIERLTRDEAVPAFETRRRTRDGRVLDVWATVTLLRDAAGRAVGVATTERDVTGRRQAEQQIRALNDTLEQRVAERTRELKESEERIEAILNATVDAVVTIDVGGTIVMFNRSAERLFGYAADEVTGKNVSLLMPQAERLRHDDYLRRYSQTREPHIIGNPRDVHASRKDGTIFPVRLSISEVGHLGLFVGFIHDLTDARRLEEEVVNIAMLEQRRLGQELHDSTQQELTGLGLLAQNLTDTLRAKGATEDAALAARLASAIGETNQSVRSLARGLIPVPIDAEALPAALDELVRNTRDQYGLSCEFRCPSPVAIGDANTATHLYRIAQEAVGNAIRHASADTISVHLGQVNGDLVLEVRDNGIGIADRTAPHRGVGLRLMEHRCVISGGRFAIQRQDDGGTVVSCTIPGAASITA